MAKGTKTGGRRKGSTNKATDEIREILDSNVDFNEVVKKLLELTNGVQLQVMTDKGAKIYTEKPDAAAAKILMEYRWGKPQQKIEHSGGLTEIIISKKVIVKK